MKQILVLLALTFFSLTTRAQKLTSPERKKIISELENAFDLDQKTRKNYNQCASEHGANSMDCNEFRKALVIQDSLNQKVVFKVIDQYGWLPVKQISAKANKAFFYVLQHAQLQAQSRYANLVDIAFKRKEITNVEYAYFVDRLRSKQGRAQIYGTQQVTDNLGNNYLYPVEDWHLADSLRKQIGAAPLQEFLKTDNAKYYNSPKPNFKNHAVLIGHIWDINNKGIEKVSILIDSTEIGQTDANGFFILEVNKEKGKSITVTLKKEGLKQIKYPIKGDQDFYDIYAQLRDNVKL
nr:DUF6624 domain-containing protein [Pedobacter panaciterrae]